MPSVMLDVWGHEFYFFPKTAHSVCRIYDQLLMQSRKMNIHTIEIIDKGLRCLFENLGEREMESFILKRYCPAKKIFKNFCQSIYQKGSLEQTYENPI